MRSQFLGVVLGLAPALMFAQQPAKWKLVEEWRVGGEPDGALSFTDVRGLRAMPDGRLVILDYKDQQIHFLDARGKPVRTVGRKGAGPGEYRAANGLIVTPSGEIVVNDPSNSRFAVLSPTGEFVKNVLVQPWGFGYFWDARIGPDGRLNEYLSFRKTGDTANTQGRRIWASDFTKNDSVSFAPCPVAGALKPGDYSYSYRTARGGGIMQVPYVQPSVGGATDAVGNNWYGVSPDYLTLERHVAGNCSAGAVIHLAGPRLPVTARARDSAEASVRKFAERYTTDAPDLSKIPKFLPAYSALYLDNTNRLWVERPTVTDARRLEVFTQGGAPVATLDLPIKIARQQLVVITADHVYAFTSDEDGLQYLVSLKILRT